jgi:mannose-6-phosphate isomerase-like protein (cupin superfamily)
MAVHVVRLQRDRLRREYGVDTQRLQPWAVLNAPFESAWAVVRAGTQSTLHSHHEHEIFVAVKGQAVIECDGARTTFRTGDVAFFPPGVHHCVHNDGPEDFEFYSIWWDAEMAECFVSGEHTELPA